MCTCLVASFKYTLHAALSFTNASDTFVVVLSWSVPKEDVYCALFVSFPSCRDNKVRLHSKADGYRVFLCQS